MDYKKEHKIFPVVPNIEKIQNKRMLLSMMKEDDNEPFFDKLIIKYKE